MSSGAFTRGFYECNNGDKLTVRYQPESVIAAVNPAAAGPATFKGSARISGGTRQIGTVTRAIYAVWKTAPAGYKAAGSLRIPIFTPAAYEAIQIGQEITYLGGTAEVTGYRPERRR